MPSRVENYLNTSLTQQFVDVDDATLEVFRGDMPLAIMPGEQLHDRLKAAFEEVVLFDVEDRLKEIKAPTLVVGGRHDPIVPVEESIAIHESIPNSSFQFPTKD